ncbi:MAG: hypothetical protein IKJ46_03680, partial [Tidjanibacter sp.]|nr:hypothetical protein [Tidjanibacter sp.]
GDDALRLLELHDVHNILGGQRLEVQLVSGGVVGGARRAGASVDKEQKGALRALRALKPLKKTLDHKKATNKIRQWPELKRDKVR